MIWVIAFSVIVPEKKTAYGMSKDKEGVLIDEKIYLLQGAKPKVTGTQGLPAIGPNSTGGKEQSVTSLSSGVDRLFQENKSRMAKAKHNRRRPKELISIDNVSLATAQQVNKIPYRRTNSAPLTAVLPTRKSPSRMSPSRVFPSRVSPSRVSPSQMSLSQMSPSPRTPDSAPAQMLSSFQWPPIPEHQGPHCYNNNSAAADVFDPEQTEAKLNADKKNRNKREVFSKTENSGPEELQQQLECDFESKVVDKVFELPPILASRTQRAVSGSPQKVAGQEKIHIDSSRTEESWAESKQDLKDGIGPRTFSPDSLVAQLIANSKTLTLNDSIESPALQQRKKLSRTSQKNFF